MLISGICKGPDGAKATRRKMEAKLFNLINNMAAMTMTIKIIAMTMMIAMPDEC